MFDVRQSADAGTDATKAHDEDFHFHKFQHGSETKRPDLP
jgi:hypothetical protein